MNLNIKSKEVQEFIELAREKIPNQYELCFWLSKLNKDFLDSDGSPTRPIDYVRQNKFFCQKGIEILKKA